MRTRRTILILAALTFILVVALMFWQLSSLQGLRMQIASGLHGNLQRIANDAARQLQDDYLKEMDKGIDRLKMQVKPEYFKEKNLQQLRRPFLRTSTIQPLCNAWVVAFPQYGRNRFNTYEYKSPSRYRRGDRSLGSWREQTDLAEFLRREMDKMSQPYETIDSMSNSIWQTALDSNLVFVFDKAFSSNTLIGSPIFQKDGKLACIVFRQTNPQQFEKVYLRDFFNYRLWPNNAPREGIEKRFLQFGLRRGQGGQLIYHSVAYGQQQFEHEAQLANFGPWLGDLYLGVSFRESNVDEVSLSIYNRNVYLIVALFCILMIVLLLLVRAAMRLFRLSRLKTEFVANVSHEIKSPLAAIRLATDSLKLGRLKDPEAMQRVLGIISDETARLDYLIHSLLDFSQLESGRKRYKKQKHDVDQVITKLTAFVQKYAGSHIELELDEAPSCTINADVQAIEQVLAILIDNARKYGEGNKRLKFIASVSKTKLRVSLQDFGPGIASQDQKIIFEKFVRIGNLDEHNVKGHGIGLSIARAIISDHEGKLSLKSSVGSGATFYFELPCSHNSPQ